MGAIYAAVQNGDGHAGASGRIPSGRRLNLGQVPGAGEVRVVGLLARRNEHIQLRAFNMWVARQQLCDRYDHGMIAISLAECHKNGETDV